MHFNELKKDAAVLKRPRAHNIFYTMCTMWNGQMVHSIRWVFPIIDGTIWISMDVGVIGLTICVSFIDRLSWHVRQMLHVELSFVRLFISKLLLVWNFAIWPKIQFDRHFLKNLLSGFSRNLVDSHEQEPWYERNHRIWMHSTISM